MCASPSTTDLDAVVDQYDRSDVVWLHGQGSTFTGMADDADLDLVVVWSSELPTTCGPVRGALFPSGDVVLRKGRVGRVDLDPEGHHLPFPKRIGQWIKRFDLDASTRELERAVWANASDAAQTAAIDAFGSHLVERRTRSG